MMLGRCHVDASAIRNMIDRWCGIMPMAQAAKAVGLLVMCHAAEEEV